MALVRNWRGSHDAAHRDAIGAGPAAESGEGGIAAGLSV